MALRRLLADAHVLLALATVAPVLAVEVAYLPRDSERTVVASLLYFLAQTAVSQIPGIRTRLGWDVGRFAGATLFVALLIVLDGATSATLPVLFIPIVALAAATGARPGAAITTLAVVLYVTTLGIERGWSAVLANAVVPVSVMVFLAVGTRQVVASLERALDRVRRSVGADRRRARRLRAIEQVGRLLAQVGPSPAALDSIMDVLVGTFAYQYPSLYLWTGRSLRLGAQRGYENPIREFDPQVGIIGRVARTREVVFAPDVSREPDYAQADAAVVSEISVPLLADGELLGVLNVESTAAQRLNRDDLASMRMIADRLAASIALGRERQAIGERAALLGRLTAAFAELGGTLDPVSLHTLIARAATTVVACDVGILTLADMAGGAYRIAAAAGADSIIGMLIEPGEGATGGAIATRTAVLDDQFDRARYPKAAQRLVETPTVAVMAIPMLRDDAVLGALTFVRRQAGHGFSVQEREIAGLLAAQTALAITNASLHAEAREDAIRDPLTHLHNRRLLDDTLARMSAARARVAPSERRPMAAIMFDLDHFGDLNNRHGHAAGDTVLRAFADLLAARFRSSDLVARYGGEEFMVVLDGAARDDAVRAAEEIRVTFHDLEVAVPGGKALRATVSAGCAGLDQRLAAVDTMIEVADVGLAMAKAGGRDQVVAA